MSYTITNYTKSRAKDIGVTVKPSKVKGKKLDVYKNDKKVASVGAKGYGDYPTFVKTKGAPYAKSRQKAYKVRHEKYRHIVNTPSYYADKLLW